VAVARSSAPTSTAEAAERTAAALGVNARLRLDVTDAGGGTGPSSTSRSIEKAASTDVKQRGHRVGGDTEL